MFYMFTPKIGNILTHIFQMGWFNHQLETYLKNTTLHSLQTNRAVPKKNGCIQ